MELTLTAATAIALTATFVLLALTSVLWRRQQKSLNLPPGPRGWPVFGSLGLLAGALPPHRALAALASRHGAPLMHIRLGSFDVIVASTAETARLVLKTNDLAFASRPPTTFGEILAYGYKGILQTPYGPYWRMARRLCATELFSPRRVDAFEHVRAQEMRALTRALFEFAGADVEVKERLLGHTMRNILRMAVGDKWSGCYGSDEGETFRRAIGEAFAVAGTVSSAGEWLPWLGWLDVQGFVRRMKRVHKLFDRFLEQILDEHEKDREQHGDEFVARDLVDLLLELSEQEEEKETRLTRDGVKAIIQDVIAGGTETTAVTVEWAMAELLRHPSAMSAAVTELDLVVGRERWPTERDLANLPYVEAIVKETMRLHPVAPLLFPRCARENTVVAAAAAGGGGYDVPAGARVLVKAWAVARDPASWPDAPGEFRPERFLAGGAAEGVDVRGAHFQLLPFGAGRRMCPAYNLAMKGVAAALANLVHGFEWRLPEGVALEDVSMEESFGLSMYLKVPLVAVAEPRLPEHLYAAVVD